MDCNCPAHYFMGVVLLIFLHCGGSEDAREFLLLHPP
jgi:hypothetical protein